MSGRPEQQFYEDILATVHEGLWVADADDRIIFFNKGMERISGVSADDAIGLSVTADFPKETLRGFLPYYFEARNSLNPVSYEADVVTPTGRHTIQAGTLTPRSVNGSFAGMICTILDVTEQRQAERASQRKLESLEWMLSPDPGKAAGTRVSPPRYGDLSDIATLTIIQDAVGRDTLRELGHDFLQLMGTSFAVYEKNGDYAIGIVSSDWCRFLDAASRDLCGTDDNRAALACGRWLCHESCWSDASQRAIERGEPVDIECHGGMRIYAVPLRAGDEIVGAINFGYGSPPLDRISEIAAAYGLDAGKLRRVGEAYEVRPPFIVQVAKQRLATTAHVIGEAVLRHRAETALAKSRDRYHLMAENIGEVFWLVTPGWDEVLYVSPAYEKVWGRPPSELYASPMSWLDAVIPGDREQVKAYLRRKTEGEIKSIEFPEYRILRPDGSIRWIRAKGTAIGDEVGTVRCVAGIAMDVTAERESARQYQVLFQTMREGFALHEMICDDDGKPVDYRFLEVNHAFETITGLRADDIVGRTVLEVFPGIEPSWITTYGRVALTGEPMVFEDHSATLDKHFQVTAFQPVTNQFACIFTDTTKRVLTEEALRNSEERLRLVIRGSQDAPWDWDLVANEIYYSPQWWRQLGYDPDELPPEADLWERLMHPEDAERVGQILAAALRDGTESYEIELRLRHKDGHYVPVLSRAIITRDEDGTPVRVTGTNMDLTDMKCAEKEHDALQKRLLQAQKMESIGRLAGGVAHDFNNLLMGIMSYVELCRDEIDSGHPIRPWLDEITADAERSAAIARQLLAFARKQLIAPRVVDLNEAVGSLLKMLRRLIGEAIDLSWKPGTNVWPVLIDPAQLDQILANLAINARDAIGGVGKLTIATDAVHIDDDYCRHHADAAPGDFAVLGVSDDGCGMDRETLENVFEPFFTTKDLSSGTGLGLATIYGIVKQNKGFISVCSKVGQGTTFRIYLPRHQSEGSPDVTDEAARPVVGGNERILIVEDEKSIRVTTQVFLEDLGYHVLGTATPGEARHLVADGSAPPDLLLTDVVLPGLNGRDLAGRLKAKFPALKVLYMSGYTADIIAHHDVLDGVDFLAKPFTRTDLAHVVRTILDRPGGGAQEAGVSCSP